MHFLNVRRHTLLLIASIVWLAAGINIVRIGLEAYANGHISIINAMLSLAVGAVFWSFVFGKLVTKHTGRITSYEDERHFFLKFFDVPSFVIMAIMMTGGISIRAFGLAPEAFIAVFYTGLGTALTLAGASFCRNWLLARPARA